MGLIATDTPCPGCGYNLRGLEQQHRCPECGFRYDLRPRAAAARSDTPQFGRMSAFDKTCAVLGVIIGVIFIFGGGLGLFLGIKMSFELPAVLGVFPVFVGWGIYRTFRIAWRADRVARQLRAPATPIPSIYRDPIPTAEVERLDRELAERIDDAQPEPSTGGQTRQ